MKQTTLTYLEAQDCYLMMLRNKKLADPNEGKWIGVGGKFGQDETPQQCAQREIQEETGFIVDDLHFEGLIHFVSDTWEDEDMYLFTADVNHLAANPCTGALKLPSCNEGTLAWIPKEGIPALNLWEGDRVFLSKLVASQPVGELTLRYHGDKLVEAISKIAPTSE